MDLSAFDVFFSNSGNPGLLQDYTALAVDFVHFPVIAYLYLWLPGGIEQLFCNIMNAGILKSNDSFIKIIYSYRKYYKSKTVFFVILALSILISANQMGSYLGWFPWRANGGYLYIHPISSIYRLPFWTMLFYMLFFSIFNVFVTIIVMKKLFKTNENELVLMPLHPDHCGGLGCINQFAKNIEYGIASVGLVISATTIYELQHGTLFIAYPVVLAIVSYLVLSPILYFQLFGTAHEAMQKAKNRELLDLAKQIRNLYFHAKDNISEKDYHSEFDLLKYREVEKIVRDSSTIPRVAF